MALRKNVIVQALFLHQHEKLKSITKNNLCSVKHMIVMKVNPFIS